MRLHKQNFRRLVETGGLVEGTGGLDARTGGRPAELFHFRREVLHHLCDIDYGRTESYTEVAAATGHPSAVRAVGSACATNPVPIVVPCHRVLRSDGSLGGYRGGLPAKRVLLDLEARG